MGNYSELDAVLTYHKNLRKSVRFELRNRLPGRLLIVNTEKQTLFLREDYETGKRRVRGIKRKPQLVYKLAHQAYLEELLRRLESNIPVLEDAERKCKSLHPQAVLNALPKNYGLLRAEAVVMPARADAAAFRLISKQIDMQALSGSWPQPSRDEALLPRRALLQLQDMDASEWAALPYCDNRIYAEQKIHLTARGVRCRSKSEALLLEAYDARGIYYHYDEILCIDDELISPDIIALRKDGRFVYHEHFGLQDHIEYRRHGLRKLERYEAAGIIPGRNLLLSYDDENGGIDLQLIEALLDHYF